MNNLLLQMMKIKKAIRNIVRLFMTMIKRLINHLMIRC
jgi:hypothetical protein